MVFLNDCLISLFCFYKYKISLILYWRCSAQRSKCICTIPFGVTLHPQVFQHLLTQTNKKMSIFLKYTISSSLESQIITMGNIIFCTKKWELKKFLTNIWILVRKITIIRGGVEQVICRYALKSLASLF